MGREIWEIQDAVGRKTPFYFLGEYSLVELTVEGSLRWGGQVTLAAQRP